jgi:hypothetical protein
MVTIRANYAAEINFHLTKSQNKKNVKCAASDGRLVRL